MLVTVTRSGRTKLLDPRCDLRNNASTGFAWGYNGSGPAQLALAILIDYFPTKPGGKALAEALYEPFKFTVIAALPDCWKMNFEEVGIALCRTLTEEPDLLNRVISSLESAVLDEIVGRQERNKPLNPAELSESIVGAIAERMKFSAILVFITLWMFVVYFPLAHMVWGIDGFMNGVWNPAAKIKAMTSPVEPSSTCLPVGPRSSFA